MEGDELYQKNNQEQLANAKRIAELYGMGVIPKNNAIENLWHAFEKATADDGKARIARTIRSLSQGFLRVDTIKQLRDEQQYLDEDSREFWDIEDKIDEWR